MRVCLALLSLWVLLLPAPLRAEESPVVFLSDTEGQLSRLTSFLDRSEAFEKTAHGWDLKQGARFVFGGDVLDRGDGGRAILRVLLDLKARFPDRVTFLLGNRDLFKLSVRAGLAPAELLKSPPGFKEFLKKKGQDTAAMRADPIMRLDFLLSGGLDHYKSELLREGLPATDDAALQSVLADVAPEGLIGRYLSQAQIAAIDQPTGTLFVHGAANEKNLWQVPGHQSAAKGVQEAVDGLNRWAKDHVTAALQGKEGGDVFLNYMYGGEPSVITDRYFDDVGKLSMPAAEFRRQLLAQGVRRIAVGHTPAGEVALVMREGGFEVVLGDTSFNGSRESSAIAIYRDGVKIQSDLPGYGAIVADTIHGPAEIGQLEKGELVAGALSDGSMVRFHKNEDFEPLYRRTAAAPLSCSGMFGKLGQWIRDQVSLP